MRLANSARRVGARRSSFRRFVALPTASYDSSMIRKTLFPRLSRRGVMKWVGLMACISILVAFFASGYVGVQGHLCRRVSARLVHGTVEFQASWSGYSYLYFTGYLLRPGYRWSYRPPLRYVIAYYPTRVFISLWFPFIVFAIPTAIMWYRDRRPPPGHCRTCRYDLTGNESGVCPECGTEVAEA